MEESERIKDDSMFTFKLLQAASTFAKGPRLGNLAIKGRGALQTPNFIALTSRGVVPHLSHDVLAQHTNISGVYMALEDCKQPSTLLICLQSITLFSV